VSEHESTELVAVPNQVQLGTIPMRPEEVIERASQIATKLAKIIKDRGLSIRIRNKDHVLIEGWTTLGAILGVIPRERETTKIEQGYEAYVELLRTSDGAVVGGASAVCSYSENRWASADEYAVRSMAITRATGKAYRLGFSWIMVLAGYSPTPAEEMPQNEVIEGNVKETSPKVGTSHIPSTQQTSTVADGTTSKPTAMASTPMIRQKNQWEPDVLKTLKSMGLVDSPQHLVAILNRSPFVNVPYGELAPYDAAVYLCGWHDYSGKNQSMSTDEKNPIINKLYMDGAPKEWEDAAKHILGMKL
jgi:hypothetical protein